MTNPGELVAQEPEVNQSPLVMDQSRGGLLAGVAIAGIGVGGGLATFEAVTGFANVEHAAAAAFAAPKVGRVLQTQGNVFQGAPLAETKTQPVGSFTEFNNGIHYLDESSPVPIGPVPGEPTDPGEGGDTSPAGGSSSGTGSGSETAPTDPKVLKQNCIDVALQKPKIVNAEVLHAGNFDVEKGYTQSWSLSTQYSKSMPGYCAGLYGRGNKAKAQAFHDGHWVNEGEWHSVIIIPEDNKGSWDDIGNVKQAYFPVCKARILLKATSADLTKHTSKSWVPHPTIASRTFPPIPVKKILPHKPKAC